MVQQRVAFRLPVAAFGLLVLALPASAQVKVAADCVSAPGALLARGAGEKTWHGISAKDTIPPETFLVALFDAHLKSPNGAVEVRMLADIGQRGPLPVLESAITTHAAVDHDLDITLERGLIILHNAREKGEAKVQLRLHGEKLDVVLREPKTRVAVEMFGRHAPGMPNLDDPKLDAPVIYVYVVVLQGEAFVKEGGQGFRLHAPPGPAVLVWDSILREADVRRLDQLPETCQPLTDKEKKVLNEICDLARPLAKDLGGTLDRITKSDRALERRAGVTCMGAVDDLPRLLAVLSSSPHVDARDQAVLVLRNWVGEAPGQTAKLYQALTTGAKNTPIQAKTLLQLLYGFDEEARHSPSTFELLIQSLSSREPAVRHLAHWHLVRLAPAGRAIEFDALGPEAARTAGVARWRALIPEGRLPPAPEKKATP